MARVRTTIHVGEPGTARGPHGCFVLVDPHLGDRAFRQSHGKRTVLLRRMGSDIGLETGKMNRVTLSILRKYTRHAWQQHLRRALRTPLDAATLQATILPTADFSRAHLAPTCAATPGDQAPNHRSQPTNPNAQRMSPR